MERRPNSKVVASTQTLFSLLNPRYENLTISPPLYMRMGAHEPYTWTRFEEMDWSGGSLQVSVRPNEHRQACGYAESAELRVSSPASEYLFDIAVNGKLVTYSTSSPGARVLGQTAIFDDFVTLVSLVAGSPREDIRSDNDETALKCEVLGRDKSELIRVTGSSAPAPMTRVSSIVFPDTEAFSFFSNVNLYFDGHPVYMSAASGLIVPVTRHGSGNPTLGGYYYLTPGGGYPRGVTRLRVKDGFSHATTILRFDHDMAAGMVTMTIESCESRVCDIRGVETFGAFPHCICIGL